MYRVVYLDDKDNLNHKGGFDDMEQAMKWIEEHREIRALRILKWDDDVDCFITFRRL